MKCIALSVSIFKDELVEVSLYLKSIELSVFIFKDELVEVSLYLLGGDLTARPEIQR